MRFEDLLVEHLDWIARLARRYYNGCDAEDLQSETICRLLNSKDRFMAEKDFKPWAKAVMENLFRTQYKRRCCVSIVAIADEYPYRSPDRLDIVAECREVIDTIEKLRKEYVSVEALGMYVSGYEYSEIAVRMSVSVGTVKSRIATARNMLKKMFGE